MRTLALQAARPYGFLPGAGTKARIGAMLLGYWSVDPIRNGPHTVAAITASAQAIGLLELRTLRECRALGIGLAKGYASGARHGSGEIIGWVMGSESLADAKKVGGWR